MTLNIFKETSSLRLPRQMLNQTASAIARDHSRLAGATVSSIFCSDRRIRLLNQKFRHQNRTTDVLSFAYNEPDLLGEIYISLDRAKVQGRTYGTGYYGEIRRLFVHGMFHLLGFTHRGAGDRQIMEAEESRYS